MNGRRTRNIYDPGSGEPFRLSRSKLENFIRCPLCFYLNVRLGVAEPAGYPFNLNLAVDHLLKKEFDIHRAKGEPHPLMKHYGIEAVPFLHADLSHWRENFRGIQYVDKSTNFLVTGAVDDIWINGQGELHVVDYKATAKDSEVNIDAEWQKGYKRQIEIYQWLLRQNGFRVSRIGYFVYANGRRDRQAFDAKLEFAVKILPYAGNDSWVAEALESAKKCLDKDILPRPERDCEYCIYRASTEDAIREMST